MALKAGLLTRKTVRGCAILVILVCYLLGLFERAELIAVDLRYHLNSSPALPELLLVVIDQTSLKESSQWPWPRGYYADLIAKLRAGDAKLIALDLDFSASSHALEDQKLVHASSAAGNVILSAFHEDKILYGDVKIKSANLPFPELASAAAGMGSILFPVDPDGTMRRAYLVDQIHGTPVLSLAAEITRQFSRESRTGSIPRSGPIQIGQHTIRPGTDGTFYINYAGGPGSFPSVSFVDVLEGRIDPSRFRDKIVLVGASAMELRDIWNTPFGLTPGVEIQANTVQTLLSGKTIYRIPPWATLLLIVFGSLLSEVLFSGSIYRRHIKGLTRFVLFSALTVGIAFLFGLISLYVFKYWRILLDTVPVFTAIIVHYVFASYALNLLTSQSVEVKKVSLSTLHSVGNLSLKNQPLDNALDFILAMLKGVVDIRYMIVDLYHPKTQQPLKRLVYGEDLNQNDHKLTSQCQSWVDKAVASKESIIVPNLKTVLQDENSIQPEIRSSLFVPLLTHQQQHGVLHAHRLNSKRFEEEDVKMLYTVANQLAMNLENMELVKEVQRMFFSSMEAFSTALELRDNETEGHSRRVTAYALEVGQRMGLEPKMLEILRQGSLLHDIGKIGVPDAILKKPGSLSLEEMKIIKKHPEYGYWMLKNVDFPEEVALILLQHHERYDGAGYPAGLQADQILIHARIFTVVDTYDAIRSDRPYHKGISHDAAIQRILDDSGVQFDPDVVEAFLSVPEEKLETICLKVNATAKEKGLSRILSQREEAG